MAQSKATTVAAYLDEQPPERRAELEQVLRVVRKHMPKGYAEGMAWGMIGWVVPLSVMAETYNGQPLCYAGLAAQKHYNSLYLMGTVAGSLVFLVLFETIGKIGAVGRRYDEEKSHELYQGMDARGEKKLKLDRRASWHPFNDLTPGEKGEEDVGIESEIGHLEEKDLTHGQRWAYAA